MPIKSGAGHAYTSELNRDIRARGCCRDTAPPRGQHLVVLVGIGTGPHQTANMVQDNGQLRDGFGKVGKLVELREVHPSLQGQSHASQNASASPELRAAELTLYLVCGRIFDLGMRVPCDRMADAPEPVGTGRL